MYKIFNQDKQVKDIFESLTKNKYANYFNERRFMNFEGLLPFSLILYFSYNR